MESWKLSIPGSTDISFCKATDCKTYCRRNRSLECFKQWLKRETEICGEYARYSVSDFQDRCSDYRRQKNYPTCVSYPMHRGDTNGNT